MTRKFFANWGIGVGFVPVTGTRRLPDLVARLPKSRAALEFAQREHAGQRRSSDGAPFIEHPLEVGWLLYRAGAPDQLIAAGLLHDVLEKTTVSAGELKARFGSPIADLVSAVSEDERIDGYEPRKTALRQQVAAAGAGALMVFAADKVSKVRELRAALAAARRRRTQLDDSLLPPWRLAHLHHCLGMLEQRLGDSPLVRLLRSELGELNHDLKESAAPRAAA